MLTSVLELEGMHVTLFMFPWLAESSRVPQAGSFDCRRMFSGSLGNFTSVMRERMAMCRWLLLDSRQRSVHSVEDEGGL